MDRIFSKQETGRYVIVGFSGVLLDYGIYSLLLYAGVLTDYAKFVSFALGAAYVFFAQRYWTFHSKGCMSREIPRYVALYVATAVLNVIVNKCILSLGCAYWVAFSCATGGSTIGNFVGQKFFVFATKGG